MELKTPLYESHLRAGGKMVAFAGFMLPVQYAGGGVIAEHNAVRKAAGLFDVSHMGEFMLSGKDALANLQFLLTNDYSSLTDGFVHYSPMCYENGGVVDDLLVYKFNDDLYLIVVNAANKSKDYQWIKDHLSGEAELGDISSHVAQMALQGPKAIDIMRELAAAEDIPKAYYSFKSQVKVAGKKCLLSRTGYTGEDGFELYCSPADAPLLWDRLLAAGEQFGLIPCGLGARDTLRMEAAMPLYGHEIDADITPLEAGLGSFVKLDKEDFIGKQALEEANPPPRRRVGLKMIDKGIAREGCEVFADDRRIGYVCSGTMFPYLGYAGATALVDIAYKPLGTKVIVDVRGRKLLAEVIKLPFYQRHKTV